MKTYEFLFIISPQFSDEELPGILDNVFAEVKKEGGEIKSHKVVGRQALAYPIDHKKHGVYVLTEIQADSSSLSNISRALKLTPEVLRFDISKDASLIDLSFEKAEDKKIEAPVEEKPVEEKKEEEKVEEKLEAKETTTDTPSEASTKEEEIVEEKPVEEPKATEEKESPSAKATEDKEVAEEEEVEEVESVEEVKEEKEEVEEKIPLDDLDKKLDEILNEEVL